MQERYRQRRGLDERSPGSRLRGLDEFPQRRRRRGSSATVRIAAATGTLAAVCLGLLALSAIPDVIQRTLAPLAVSKNPKQTSLSPSQAELYQPSPIVQQDPSAKSEPFPKTGTIVDTFPPNAPPPNAALRVLAGSQNAVFQLYDTSGNKHLLSIFVRAGETGHVFVPQGTYQAHYGEGTSWYGNEAGFGSEGHYETLSGVQSLIADQTKTFDLRTSRSRPHPQTTTPRSAL